jgi:excisionase family DNA binding protein
MVENANYICITDVAQLYHITRNSVYKIIEDQGLEVYKLGNLRKSFIKRDALEALFTIN